MATWNRSLYMNEMGKSNAVSHGQPFKTDVFLSCAMATNPLENKLLAMESAVALKAKHMQELLDSYKDINRRYLLAGHETDQLVKLNQEKLSQSMEIRKEVMNEVKLIRDAQEKLQSRRIKKVTKQLEVTACHLTTSLEKVARLEEISPFISNTDFQEQELLKRRADLHKLQRESLQKRCTLQRLNRGRVSVFSGLMEQMQTMSDLEWELSELKKEEEEAEAMAKTRNLNLERKNQQLKNRIQERLAMKKMRL